MDKFVEGKRRDDGRTFWCPNGHQLGFTKPEPELEILRTEVKTLKEKLEASEREVSRLRAELDVWAPRKENVA